MHALEAPGRRALPKPMIPDDSAPFLSRNLDVLRAVAAISVVAVHTELVEWGSARNGGWASALEANLGDGVYLFFAISGYLICRPFVRSIVTSRPMPHTRSFYLRRLARIYPAWWVALLAALLLAPQGGPPPSTIGVASHGLIAHGFVPGQTYGVIAPGWTLTLEIQFYLLVPVMARAAARLCAGNPSRLAGVILLAGGGSLLYSVVRDALIPDNLGFAVALAPAPTLLQQVADTLAVSLPATFLFFAPGILVAVLVESQWLSLAKAGHRPLLLVVSGVGCWVASAFLLSAPHEPFPAHTQVAQPWAISWTCAALLLSAGSGLMVLAAHVVNTRSAFLATMARLGVISYGIYLWHWVVLHVLLRVGFRVQVDSYAEAASLGAVAVAVGLTLPCAWISRRYVEEPVIAWARRATMRREPSPRPVAAPALP